MSGLTSSAESKKKLTSDFLQFCRVQFVFLLLCSVNCIWVPLDRVTLSLLVGWLKTWWVDLINAESVNVSRIVMRT